MSDLLIKNVNLDYARKHGGLNLHLYVGKEDAMEVAMNDAFTDDCLGFCKVKELPPHGRLIDADKIEFEYDPHFGGRIIATSDAIANAPTVLEASKED